MWSRVFICGVVSVCLLWPEAVTAGTSFLSPADMPKSSVKRPPKKLPYNNEHRREALDLWDSPVEAMPDEEKEFRVTFPLDINLKMAEKQFQKQKAALQDILLALFSVTPSQDTQDGAE
ncbi:ghrelin isoform X1 [Xenopus laevis]|uniref:Ghrelin n=2 Tax=Xenopus laevis TaxID=8355 RepID=H7CE67_XENLA|nr:ghrelin precursor [Xenopus laevis]XP_041445046.1 ghrelin isoform X1 [Xenopus laevis]OCT85765.1 hypothetical protein XELAEV_18023936mg [Xenopus laevis]BAL70270.1 ghrelin [Xenopus laevis]